MVTRMIHLGFNRSGDTRKPITITLSIQACPSSDLVELFDLSEHEFAQLLAGQVIQAESKLEDDEPYVLATVLDASPRDGSEGKIPFPGEPGDVVKLYKSAHGSFTALEPGGAHWADSRFNRAP